MSLAGRCPSPSLAFSSPVPCSAPPPPRPRIHSPANFHAWECATTCVSPSEWSVCMERRRPMNGRNQSIEWIGKGADGVPLVGWLPAGAAAAASQCCVCDGVRELCYCECVNGCVWFDRCGAVMARTDETSQRLRIGSSSSAPPFQFGDGQHRNFFLHANSYLSTMRYHTALTTPTQVIHLPIEWRGACPRGPARGVGSRGVVASLQCRRRCALLLLSISSPPRASLLDAVWNPSSPA